MGRRRKPQAKPSRAPDFVIGTALFVLVWVVFGQTIWHNFVDYDDRVYVTQNAQVNGGLSWAGVRWAFTHAHAGNWHPLTTISHMLDCELFGLRPGPHHAVNVLLHAMAAVLLFIFLRTETGRRWPSAFAASVFAIHPLRAESVAWIAERKDVLSAVFFMGTLLAYGWYRRRPSILRYLLVFLLAGCGLMSKPMLVTLPAVLLLLDWWPYRRLNDLRSLGIPLLEKLPIVALAVGVAVTTFVIQEHSPGAIAQLPLAWRIENALVSYVVYIRQLIWPVGLVVFYPHPENTLAIWQVGLAGLILVVVSAAAVVVRLTKPYILMGWLWYLVVLFPVIGIVEVGLQGHADRYTYLPEIGLIVALTWLVLDLLPAGPLRRQMLTGAGAFIVLGLSACAWRQTSYWKNSETLWTHALAFTPKSDVAHTNMGIVLMDRGELQGALEQLETALQIRSGSTHSHYDLSLALIHTNTGYALARLGRVDDAISEWRKAIESQPDYPEAHYDLATAFLQKGALDDSIAEYEKTLALRPDDVEAHTSLGNAFAQKGRLADAVAQYRAALRTAPHAILPANNLAWIMAAGPDASLRDGAAAVELAKIVDQHSDGKNPVFIRTLAAAYAENGQFVDAKAMAQIALQFAQERGDTDLSNELESDIGLYRKNQPLRDPSLTNAK